LGIEGGIDREQWIAASDTLVVTYMDGHYRSGHLRCYMDHIAEHLSVSGPWVRRLLLAHPPDGRDGDRDHRERNQYPQQAEQTVVHRGGRSLGLAGGHR
jgi:hypothetical protein